MKPFSFITTTLLAAAPLASGFLFATCGNGVLANWDSSGGCHTLNVAHDQVKFQSNSGYSLKIYSQKDCQGNAKLITDQERCHAAIGGAKVWSIAPGGK